LPPPNNSEGDVNFRLILSFVSSLILLRKNERILLGGEEGMADSSREGSRWADRTREMEALVGSESSGTSDARRLWKRDGMMREIRVR
jgi:hypothetical protein